VCPWNGWNESKLRQWPGKPNRRQIEATIVFRFLPTLKDDKISDEHEGEIMDFDPTQGHILIWQPPLPPETTMLIPADRSAEQVDLRAPAPLGDPACWLTEQYFEGDPAAAPLENAQPAGAKTDHQVRQSQGDQPDGVPPVVKMVANMIAANAMLEFIRGTGRKEESEDEIPKAEDKEKK